MRIAILAMLVLACDGAPQPAATPAVRVEEPKPEPKPEAKPEPEPEPIPKTNMLGEPIAAPEAPPVDAGPAAVGSATTQQREQAVLELLAGAAPAARFVRDDVDPDKAFDKDLRDVVAPHETGGAYPQVRQGKAQVSGGLDRDIVRRIVRSHINEVRYCYNIGLARHPGLGGEVTVDFAIASDGKVTTAAVSRSTLRGTAGKALGECLGKAVRRWKFPKPLGGGTVDVVYPFELRAN